MGSKEARATVRARRARIEAARAAQARRVDALAEDYFVCQTKIDAAEAKVSRAQAELEKVQQSEATNKDSAIARMLQEGGAKPAEVADLLDLSTGEVNAAARRHTERQPTVAAVVVEQVPAAEGEPPAQEHVA